ncbi:MAG: phenylalanine--tRNA ligase subunit beta, partial [Methylococcaceae bacterium]
ALHPGQTAEIQTLNGENVGWLGMLHPNLEKQLGFDTQVFLFELDQNLILHKRIPVFKSLSKYPSVRRDLALIVKEEISATDIINCIRGSAGPALQDVIIFDIYRGKGVEEGSKSVALSLIMQEKAQTLTDSEIDTIISRVLDILINKIHAKLRD